MKFAIKYLLPLLAGTAFLLTSCVDQNYSLNNGIDNSIGFSGSLALPLANAKVELLDVLPDDFGEFALEVEDDNVYLLYETGFDLTAEFVSGVDLIPDQQFTIPIPFMPENIGVQYEFPLEYEFEGLNQEQGDQRLDSLIFGVGEILTMELDCGIPFTEDSYVTFEFDPKQIQLDPNLYPDNSATFHIGAEGRLKNCDVDFSGAKIIFNRDGVLYDKLTINLVMNLTTAETVVNETITHRVNFSLVMPRVVYGMIYEDTPIFQAVETMPFAYTQDLQEDDFFLPVYDPELHFNINNSIGVNADYVLDYVKVYNSAGEEVYADFGGSRTLHFNVDYPKFSEVKDLTTQEAMAFDVNSISKHTEFVLNREYGGTNKLFSIRGEQIEYGFSVVAAAEPDGSFLFMPDSRIELDVLARLPLRFEGNKDNPDNNFRLIVRDTVDVDLSSIKDYFTPGEDGEFSLYFTHKNHLPLDTDFSLVLLDENKQPLTLQSSLSFSIPAAPVNEYGEAIAESEEGRSSLKFQGEDCNTLIDKCRYIAFVYLVDSKQFNNIWLHSNDWLSLSIGAFLTGEVDLGFGGEDENPVSDPTEDPTDNPADNPDDFPADEPFDEPVDGPVDNPFDEPFDDPVDHPVEDPVDGPVDYPFDGPVDNPADDPAAPDDVHGTL